MSLVEVVAFYAALNDRWPSYPVLLAFAADSGIRMQDKPPGGMGPVREAAAKLLDAEGLTPPGPPKALGKGKRLTYRYPVNDIPGAPRRDPDERRDQPRPNPRVVELRRELAVLSLRMWLASLHAGDKRTRAAYLAWQAGTGWTAPSGFDQHGGFAALKHEATVENASARRAGVKSVPDVVRERAEVVRAELRGIHAAGRVRQPEPVPFGDALRAVLAGPVAVGTPPKQ